MGAVERRVWKTLLRDAHSQQLVVFMGGSVGLLLLRLDLEADRFGTVEIKTHPPLPSRLLIMFHVVGSITKHDSSFWENRSAGISTAISLITISINEEKGIGIRGTTKDEELAETATDVGTRRSGWDSLNHLSIVDAMQRIDDIHGIGVEMFQATGRSEPTTLTPLLHIAPMHSAPFHILGQSPVLF